MQYNIGIDIGSTTLKAVITDENDKVIYKSYERHFSKIRELTKEKLTELSGIIGDAPVKMAVTGSAGLGVAEECGFDFIQEVFATAGGVQKFYPDTDVVIELGGEDAKIIFLKGALEERMNSTCAGGTGAFIDQMASLLDVDVTELDALSQNHKFIYPIASRCGVFAKTDIQPLLNQGADKADIAASIYQAVVDQTIAGLAQGRPIEGKILFLGGPLAFSKGLRERFVETLKLSEENAVFPDMAQYFVALGASIYAGDTDKTYTCAQIIDIITSTKGAVSKVKGLDPLFENESDYQAFCQRHNQSNVMVENISTYEGNAYLGIDAGSTTTKIVLISEDNKLLYSYYHSNLGSPIEIVVKQLTKIYELCEDRVKIKASAVTGYGEDLIKSAFGIDEGIVETIAHYRAAKHFNPNVDFIIDIGGQDIKCFEIKDNSINSIMLNEACSSGCGSFIETFAKSLGYSIEDFAKIGLFAEKPVDLGTRCTVFMNSSVKEAQKNGATVADISAGISMSVVKNALYKVIRIGSANDIGENIVVQGGTFANDAVLRSFEKLIGKNVVRPVISGLMGAFGAALYAKNSKTDTSTIITKDELSNFSRTSKVVKCNGCTNKCSLTVNTFKNGNKSISGNKCETPVTGSAGKNLPDMYKYKLEKLLSYKSEGGKRGKVGLPLVLNMYENLPLWHTFFDALGFEVVTSDVSSRKMYSDGQHTIPSDTVCYPAKLVHGHIMNLMDKKVDFIFYPCMTYNFDEGISDKCFNCPVVAYYPEVIKANIVPETKFMYPYLTFNDAKSFVNTMHKTLLEVCHITKGEIKSAFKKALCEYHAFKEDIACEGKRVLEIASEKGLHTIALLGRPYHVDPEVNHSINKLLVSLGFAVVTEDAFHEKGDLKPDINILNQWTYHARMFNAAKKVCNMKNADVVQLVSFGCGIDAITTDELKNIMRDSGKLYTQIKIDEMNNSGVVKIRLRSLKSAIEERGEASAN